MAFNPRQYFTGYFRKKKPLGIFFDALFVVIILLLLIPATRKETAAFFIRWTSFPASALDEEEQFVVSQSAQNWKLYSMEGGRLDFSELNDKPVFLNIWATWCPPCIAELPGILDLHEAYGSEVSFVLVSNEDPEVVQAFAGKHGYESLPFYFAGSYPPEFGTRTIPATFILDGDGKVVLQKKGAARWNSDRTRSLLDELTKR